MTDKESALFIGTANALAGACGGVSAMLLIYPLDVIRCRLQAQADTVSKDISIIRESNDRFFDESRERKDPSVENVLQSIDNTINESQRYRRSSIKHCIQDILNEEGINGFYKALDTQLIGIFYSDIVYFFTVTFLKQYLYGKREVSAIANLQSSTLAGICVVMFTLPYWTVQTQLMLQKKSKSKNKSNKNRNDESESDSDSDSDDYKGFMDGLIQIYKKSGINNGFYKGIGPSLMLVSNPIIQFVSYEKMIQFLKEKQNVSNLDSLTYFICGAIAKSIATFATYPLQVMKTQLQKRDSKFDNMIQCFQFLFEFSKYIYNIFNTLQCYFCLCLRVFFFFFCFVQG